MTANRTALQTIPFKFHDKDLRVVIQDADGNPWFVRQDACLALRIRTSANVSKRLHPNDQVRVYLINSRGQRRLTPIISEAGLYDLILRSDKPEARAFQRWVVTEVLPTIRRTGSYQSNQNVIPQQDAGRLMQLTAEMVVEILSKPGSVLDTLIKEVRSLILENDPRVAAVAYKPMLQILIDLDVSAKGRRTLSQVCSRRLSRWCIRRSLPIRISPETERLLFHADAVRDWLVDEGRVLIDAHGRKGQLKQTVLKLVSKQTDILGT